jgi:hypothetical protein
MAAHGRNNKWIEAMVAQGGNSSSNHIGNPGDSAASGSDSNPCARSEGGQEWQVRKFTFNGSADIGFALGGKRLANVYKWRNFSRIGRVDWRNTDH